MEKFSADRYYSLATALRGLRASFDKVDSTELVAEPDSKALALKWHNNVKEQCEAIGLTISSKCISEMIRRIQDEKPTAGEWSPLLAHLEKTIRWELEDKLFLYVPPDAARFYDQREMFGSEVNAKFPTIQFDMVEAGNCYATGRGTACVFHLMRIMEVGVQELGKSLGVAMVNQKVWQNILDEVNKAIKSLDPKDPKTVELCQASANLYSVKLAWRNEVMHPKDIYTLEEAENLIRQVKIFMGHLTTTI